MKLGNRLPIRMPHLAAYSDFANCAIIRANMKPRTNGEWLADLKSTGKTQALAIEDLRAYLLRAARYSLNRQRGELVRMMPSEIEELAEDCAQEALVAVLQHLDDFRLESKFTTWAYKFAVNISLNAARREIWKHVSLDQLLEQEAPVQIDQDDQTGTDPQLVAIQNEVWKAVRDVISNELTDRQRQVFQAIVLDDVPLDELARLWNSNRNALYKLLHDTRRKLKAELQTRGFALTEIMDTFSVKA